MGSYLYCEYLCKKRLNISGFLHFHIRRNTSFRYESGFARGGTARRCGLTSAIRNKEASVH